MCDSKHRRVHEAHRNDDELVTIVSDEGAWRDQPRPSAAGYRGRGLPLIRQLTHTDIDHRLNGTTVTLRTRDGCVARCN